MNTILGFLVILIIIIIVVNSTNKKKKPVNKYYGSNDKNPGLIKKSFELDFEDSVKVKGKFLVVDIETTGLIKDKYADITESENFPRIVQIAWLLLDDEMKLIKVESMYVNPEVNIPAEATRIHGITNKLIKEKGFTPLNAYRKFLDDVQLAQFIIAHNVAFDVQIIKSELFRNGFGEPLKKTNTYCTMAESVSHIKYNNRSNNGKYPKLTELAGWLFYNNTNLSVEGLHDAQTDAAFTAKCFIELNKRGLFNEERYAPPVLLGDILKPDFANAVNKKNPFYMKKVAFIGLDDKILATVVNELKLLGADIDTAVGKKTNFLITGEIVAGNQAQKMRENIAEGREARMMDISECKKIIKDYFPPSTI